jgi:hypothetical protein
MKKLRKTRREFLWDSSVALAALATAPLLSACSHATTTDELSETASLNGSGPSRKTPRTQPTPDTTLTASLENLAETLQSQYARVKTLAEDATSAMRIGFPGENGQEVLSLMIVSSGAARYPHVRIVRESTGDVANLLWGRQGVYPSIKFADDAGTTIIKGGRPLEFSFHSVQREGRGPISWLELGIKIAAIGLLFWLGASILKPIVAAIAFIAFNAMVIGIAVVGVVVVAGIVRWILDVTGWGMEDVRRMFERTGDEIERLLRQVMVVLNR